ncbi:MAG: FkbM family methyltransferase [Alphaproteobacteria bacterium]
MATVLDLSRQGVPAKGEHLLDRFREIISDPLNLLIERVPMAGVVTSGQIMLHNGLRVPVNNYYGDFSTILVINRGVHEPLEEYVFQEVLRQLDPAEPVEMIELGAYWAHYSMWLKRRFPNARTTCVEPEAGNLETGRRNFALNGMVGEFIQAFVSDEHFRVDDFLAKEPRRIDILHADIQGFELQMLMGAKMVLEAQNVQRIFVSTHSQGLHQQVVQTLKTFGYRVDVSADFANETTSFDGFVYACLPHLPPLLSGVEILGRKAICGTAPHDLVDYAGRVLAARSPFVEL